MVKMSSKERQESLKVINVFEGMAINGMLNTDQDKIYKVTIETSHGIIKKKVRGNNLIDLLNRIKDNKDRLVEVNGDD
jgi:ABC-type Na+ efflux pump permease subunit